MKCYNLGDMGYLILMLVFCLPAIIAWVKNSASRTAITILSVLNALFLPVTGLFGPFLGLILLFWALIGRSYKGENDKTFVNAEQVGCKKESDATPEIGSSQLEVSEDKTTVDQLIKLADMKDKGLLSEQEYEQAKRTVLNNNH